ncbi:amidase [Alisedimentitalea sp. MJ-SS2]|uniref:amidase n=1 Tax=Aliisedimentitalea sp. MJ-SS2 TaxID=3049795 RepID=UPI0029098A61|nr:amidase [Alisedimentitalea sp. MJ-SS2]MDU8926452.1 amidase [Alisedimentitalea sp. MJ-SS2]
MSDFLEKEALDQSAALEAGEISVEELMKLTLDRIEAVNGDVNAVVALRDRDELLAEARAADAAPRKGWMHGLPIAVKDLANVKGLPTTLGVPALANAIAEEDEIMVARMRAAGAIFIGKTNVPQLGLGSHSFNELYGTTRNPYDLSVSAGGSSGGAAAALAARMVSIADGSDMMGSLRNPAAWNNVYGLRPSWARVPSEPKGEMFLHQLATLGPMARSPRDVAALLDVQSGPDKRQPHGCSYDAVSPLIGAPVNGMRVGWLRDWGGAYPMEEDLLDTSEAALNIFDDLGIEVELVDPPFDAALIWDSWIKLRSWAVSGSADVLYASPAMRDELKPESIWEIERGLSLSAKDVHQASLIRSQWFTRVNELFATYDALLLPTTQVWPFAQEKRFPEEVAGRKMDTYHRWMEVVIPVSLLGLPCLSVPAGFGPNGLPAGLQVFGPRGSDSKMLQIGQAWHEATDFAARRPSILHDA